MTVQIHAVQTGRVKIKTAQRSRKPGGLIRVFTDTQWTEWLPIYTWVIDHPEGIILVDTGETARSVDSGYYPRWHPYYRTSVKMDVKQREEIGPQLLDLGIRAQDVKTVILTHFHTDHAGGLSHFPSSQILTSQSDYKLANSFTGRLLGYLSLRWPKWFTPTYITFRQESLGPFERSFNVTQAGDVFIVPTPGHTPGHVSVMVKSEDIFYFLAGDTSYTQGHLLNRIPDGVSPNAEITKATIDRILKFARQQPLVYLPTHDPESANRLTSNRVLFEPVYKPEKEMIYA